jgi:hypothetical protein
MQFFLESVAQIHHIVDGLRVERVVGLFRFFLQFF